MRTVRSIKPVMLMLLALGYAGVGSARCGAGIPSAGNPNCVPPDVYYNQGITQPHGQEPAQQVTVIRRKWKDRWGAISADGTAGSLGFVTGYASKRAAEKAAVEECLKGGGTDCKPEHAFRNGCAAFVVGSSGTSITSAENEAIASKDAMENCERLYGNCWVYKTACSPAELVGEYRVN